MSANLLPRLSIGCSLLALLASCGGGVDPVTGVSASGLKYTGSLTVVDLQLSGNALDNSLKVYADNTACTVFPTTSATRRAAQCLLVLPNTLKLPIRITSAADYTVYSTTLAIPAPQVTVKTNLGDLVFELNPIAAKNTVINFLTYVNRSPSFYVGTLFHRVINGFVVQGGGYVSGMTAKSGTSNPIALESNNGLTNDRGTLAMARSDAPDSATSQFYVNLVNNASLNYTSSSPGYAVFGKVVSGMEVIDLMATQPTTTVNGHPNVPVTDITITSATQTQ